MTNQYLEIANLYANLVSETEKRLPMAITEFPDPSSADENGLLAVGGDLEPESLLLAYRKGIFPWPMPGLPLLWFCPPERAILRLENFHVSRSLQQVLKKMPYRVSIDHAFERV